MTEIKPDTTDAALRELMALGEKATARPWTYDQSEMLLLPEPSKMHVSDGREGWCGEAAGANDGEFMATAANLAVPLAYEVLRLRSIYEDLERDRNALAAKLNEQGDYGVLKSRALEVQRRNECQRRELGKLNAAHAAHRAEIAKLRAERDASDSALHALVQVYHDAAKHKGIWSQCQEAACVEAQLALLEKPEVPQ